MPAGGRALRAATSGPRPQRAVAAGGSAVDASSASSSPQLAVSSLVRGADLEAAFFAPSLERPCFRGTKGGFSPPVPGIPWPRRAAGLGRLSPGGATELSVPCPAPRGFLPPAVAQNLQTSLRRNGRSGALGGFIYLS